MPSPRDPAWLIRIDLWNRRLHFYFGLYLLFFIWLFAASGLLLNHMRWPSGNFWARRKQEKAEQMVRLAAGVSDIEQAKNLMRQLDLAGEIEWLAPRQRPGRFEFRVARPGRILTIDADTSTGVASIERIQVNGWGVMNALHSFTGVRAGRPEAVRDWWLTRVWSFSMDVVCAGIVFTVLSGYWMWYRSGRRRAPGLAALAAGLFLCGYLLFGLA
jgi:hypothetical protein